jgi:IS1 family transposase
MGTFILAPEKRLATLAALVDGNSERAAERMTGVNRETVGRYAMTFGAGAQHLHNRLARDLSLSLIEVDEIWSYVGKKQARVTPEDGPDVGEAYTFTALAMPSRFIPTWKVGKRDQETADAFTEDLRARLVVMPAMTSDGFAPYVPAIGKNFGPGVDYAQTIKNYRHGAARGPDHRYEPPRDPFITKKSIFGAPDIKRATTAHMERNNGTMRHHIGRMRRLCYAFSKSMDHHKAAVALCYCHYNLCWIPRTTRVTPAMAAGITDHVWELPEFLDALLTAEPCDVPERKPLAHRKPVEPSRELPGGRGFIRLLSGGATPAAPAVPATPPPAPAVAAASSAAVEPAPPVDDRQLDLLAWRPRPPPPSRLLPPGQLSLFGIDFEPEK